jgi:hypothetical protein
VRWSLTWLMAAGSLHNCYVMLMAPPRDEERRQALYPRAVVNQLIRVYNGHPYCLVEVATTSAVPHMRGARCDGPDCNDTRTVPSHWPVLWLELIP